MPAILRNDFKRLIEDIESIEKDMEILKRHGEKIDNLETLLKRLFPECEICSIAVIDKDGKSQKDCIDNAQEQ